MIVGYRDFLHRYAEGGEVTRLVPGHGAVIVENVNEVLRDLVRSLS